MSRLVWGVCGGGVLAAGALTAWLQRPVELPPEAPFPAASLPVEASLPEASPVAASAVASRPPRAKVPPAAPVPPPPSPAPPPVTVARRPPPAREEGTRATQLRGRIAQALRGEHPTPVARRDAVLGEFFASGESQEPWTQEARAALDRWRETIATSVRLEPMGCYSAGCLAQVRFPDAASYEEAHRRVAGLQLGEVGPHMQLPPEHLPSGEVAVSWAVLRPEPL
ncbi:hypothetical protein SAMN05444354_105290 [Stigmatella aurantiaca]|uniref:Uncharacterized protein n=1 Tax=Stigmatella aurantiaca TaxID=41 RepID=A0A1H7PGZ2_STIAU|nr:hypothetical protein [Stigmatella aurantiaca]SEL35042.1 hypothetical protein SAMN05444354_105290 [Stigmatella aurantiaca]